MVFPALRGDASFRNGYFHWRRLIDENKANQVSSVEFMVEAYAAIVARFAVDQSLLHLSSSFSHE
jgi:hypothetical protein